MAVDKRNQIVESDQNEVEASNKKKRQELTLTAFVVNNPRMQSNGGPAIKSEAADVDKEQPGLQQAQVVNKKQSPIPGGLNPQESSIPGGPSINEDWYADVEPTPAEQAVAVQKPQIQEAPTHGGPAIVSEAADENWYDEPAPQKIAAPQPQPKAVLNEENDEELRRRAALARSATLKSSNSFKPRRMFNLETDFSYSDRATSFFRPYVAPKMQPAHFFIALLILQVMMQRAEQTSYADQVFQQSIVPRKKAHSAVKQPEQNIQQMSDRELAFSLMYQISQMSREFRNTGRAVIQVDPQYTAPRMVRAY